MTNTYVMCTFTQARGDQSCNNKTLVADPMNHAEEKTCDYVSG